MRLAPVLNNLMVNTAFSLLTRMQPTSQGARLNTQGLGKDAVAASLAAALNQFDDENPGVLAKYGWVRQ